MKLGGERFSVVYRLAGSRAEAEEQARELCIEQTVEFPSDLLARFDPAVASDVVGRLESLRPLARRAGFEATVSFAAETVGLEEDTPLPARRRCVPELTQLLNVLFGNTSLKRGVRVERLELSEGLLACFRGPRFGRRGLRRLLGVQGRPLLCSALKPMGLSAAELARVAEALALGGVDLIKDDHGLADQPFCRFEERVGRCAEAVARANARTGGRTLYLPNVSAPADRLRSRARFARDAGAGGLLVAPGLVGLDAMRLLADDDRVGLPLMAHPALLGSFLIRPDHGFSCRALLGQLMRLGGADAVIFPHHGGRFPFTPEDCRGLCEGTASAMGSIAPSFPVPAGGITLRRVAELGAFYGGDVILLIGGDLHRGPDLVESCRELRAQVERHAGHRAPDRAGPGPGRSLAMAAGSSSASRRSLGMRGGAWAGGPWTGRSRGRRPRRRSGGGARRAGAGRWSPGRRRLGDRACRRASGPRSGRSCRRCRSAPGCRRARERARGGRASPRRGSSWGRSARR